MNRVRADRLLVERGLFESRAKARAAIEAGGVTADGAPVGRAAQMLAEDADMVIVSTGSEVFIGPCSNRPTTPSASAFHSGIFLARARNSTGTVSCVKGFSASGPGLRTTLNDLAGVVSSSSRP